MNTTERLLNHLTELEARLEELDRELSDPGVLSSPAALKRLGKERADVEGKVGRLREYRSLHRRLKEAEAMVEGERDPDMLSLAEAEVAECEPKVEELEKSILSLLFPADPNDTKNAILEIRAGTGGEEAALFASDLYRMYARHGERQDWDVEVMSSSESDIGGIKEIVVAVKGTGVYGRLKYESGVHRVQRVPETEASGRIHTSAATVAVLPEAEEVDIAVHEKDLRVDVYRASGPGGQGVNTTDSAVRITHVPTGLVVTCQDERSQIKNKAKAMKILRARLLDARVREQEEKVRDSRRSQVSTGDRSARIRTYNFPQGRVTDHRINLTLYRLQEILDGDLEELVESLAAAASEERQAAERETGAEKASS
jgi:peptide chain release factor 1